METTFAIAYQPSNLPQLVRANCGRWLVLFQLWKSVVPPFVIEGCNLSFDEFVQMVNFFLNAGEMVSLPLSTFVIYQALNS